MEVEEKHSFESIPPSKATEHEVDSRRLYLFAKQKGPPLPFRFLADFLKIKSHF